MLVKADLDVKPELSIWKSSKINCKSKLLYSELTQKKIDNLFSDFNKNSKHSRKSLRKLTLHLLTTIAKELEDTEAKSKDIKEIELDIKMSTETPKIQLID